eukprot:TRINITY_DN11181_c0_g1_i1.p1 TRINITY_DN11181_c0_g1~~TRINITY_DN11181_c0_g1_i1.p1  ORF type:complete len:281 (+),score=53.39 TRINITY_DN11181_c0_g1_i1:80-922(+)
MAAAGACVAVLGAVAGLPVRHMPDDLRDRYTMGGRIATGDMFVDDTNDGKGTHYKYARADVDGYISEATRRLGAYRKFSSKNPGQLPRDKRDWIFAALEEVDLHGKNVVNYGSIDPWFESVCLAAGAEKVTTIEYNKFTLKHPQLHSRTVSECNADPAACSDFDVALSMSSFDHDGLGRYGDPLDPDGDLKAMQKAMDSLRPGGYLVLTVPVGPDVVVWNLHRRYGAVRLPLLLQGWEVVSRVGWVESKLTADANWRQSYEPIHILRKPLLSSQTDGGEL